MLSFSVGGVFFFQGHFIELLNTAKCVIEHKIVQMEKNQHQLTSLIDHSSKIITLEFQNLLCLLLRLYYMDKLHNVKCNHKNSNYFGVA